MRIARNALEAAAEATALPLVLGVTLFVLGILSFGMGFGRLSYSLAPGSAPAPGPITPVKEGPEPAPVITSSAAQARAVALRQGAPSIPAAEPPPTILAPPTHSETRPDEAPAPKPESLRASVAFRYASSRVTRARLPSELKTLVAAAQACPGAKIQVEGRIDRFAGRGANMKLTWARARNMRRWLTRQGLRSDRIQVRVSGSYSPASAASPAGSSPRRVEVSMTKCSTESGDR